MSADEIASLRHELICEGCKGQGFFRAKSRDGKSACFGARHNEGCGVVHSSPYDYSSSDQEAVEECHRIYTRDLDIKVQASKHGAANAITNANGAGATGSSSSRQPRRYVANPAESKTTKKSLTAILHLLAKGADFAKSETRIAISRTVQPAWKLCVNFSDITDKHVGPRPKLFWGLISDTDRKMSWLNTRNSVGVSIPTSGFSSILRNDYGLEQAEDYSRVMFICFGFLKVGTSGKHYIDIPRPRRDHFAVLIEH